MIKVSLEGLTKGYEPGKPVLKGIQLTVDPGELFFLLGPSGCGKSTLLRLLAGFLQPDQGAIRFGEADVSRLPPEKRGTAMVFQNYALWPHMTVRENIEFGLNIQKVAAAERDRRVAEVLDLVGMRKLADRKIPSLSGGQQQRVAVARAVVVKPKLLLLDEPLSNLDAKLRENMRTELRRICKESELTTIYVTHDQKEALSMADRIAILDQGKLQQVGSPRDLYTRPSNRFVADFIGSGNFIEGTIKNRKGEIADVETAIGTFESHCVTCKCHPGTKVTVLIRPECLRFTENAEGQNRFTAKLQYGSFLGEMCQWHLVSGDQDLIAFEIQPPHRENGSNVALDVSPQDVILLCEE